MNFREITEDGKGNIIEDKIICSLEEYKTFLLQKLKIVHKDKFPSIEKQLNAANALMPEEEILNVRNQICSLLAEYEVKKTKIKNATTLEEAHKVLLT